MNDKNFDELIRRMSRLEKSNRRLGAITIFMGLMIFTLLTVAWSQKSEPIHQMESLEIVDSEGNVVIELLGETWDGAMINMYDNNGAIACEIDANSADYGASMRYFLDGILVHETGNVRGYGPGFLINDVNGCTRAILAMYGGFYPRLSLSACNDDDILSMATIGITSSDEPEIGLYDSEGTEVFYAPYF